MKKIFSLVAVVALSVAVGCDEKGKTGSGTGAKGSGTPAGGSTPAPAASSK